MKPFENPLFAEYRRFEGDVGIYFEDRLFRSCLKTFSQKKMIGVLAQRRHLSCLFTSFCDTIYPTLSDESHRKLVQEIVREEYLEENHREAFVQELINLGMSRQEIRNTQYTDGTLKAGQRLIKFALECGRREQIYALCALRFFAELLAGDEFNFFFQQLFGNQKRKRKKSVFLGPHIDLDLAGSGGPNDGHAERYLTPIAELLVSKDDLATAKHAIVDAANIRAYFYGQYCGNMMMKKSEIKKAAQNV